MATRTGAVELTILTIHICRVYTKFTTRIIGQIDASLAAGKITAAQHDTAIAQLNAFGAFCSIMRLVTGY